MVGYVLRHPSQELTYIKLDPMTDVVKNENDQSKLRLIWSEKASSTMHFSITSDREAWKRFTLVADGVMAAASC